MSEKKKYPALVEWVSIPDRILVNLPKLVEFFNSCLRKRLKVALHISNNAKDYRARKRFEILSDLVSEAWSRIYFLDQDQAKRLMEENKMYFSQTKEVSHGEVTKMV